MRRGRAHDAVIVCATLAIVYLAKRFYSQASAAELEWVLTPTVKGVTLLTGVSFEYESSIGYLSRARSYVIAPVCAGLNFMIAAFVTLVFAHVLSERSPTRKWFLFGASAVGAYAATLVANAIRIVVALHFHAEHASYGWFTPPRLHQLLGVVVYFGALLLLAMGTRARLVPIVCYLGVTLALPLLNGSGSRAGFGEHAMIVLGAVAGITVVVSLALRKARVSC